MKKFKWPAGFPKSDAEFEQLMRAVDERLNAEGVLPWQRPLHVAQKLFQALKWTGNLFPPKELANQPGFERDVLMAKAYRWYEQVYGDALKTDFAFGYAPVRLGQGFWRVRAGLSYGSVQFFIDPNLANRGVPLAVSRQTAGTARVNVLTQVEGLTQALASRLSPAELHEFFNFYVLLYGALAWRDQLPKTDLFRMALGDYDESTAGVLAHRYGQARWAAQQAVEKTIKGLLQLGGTPFPTGQDGHNLGALAELLSSNHAISIAPALLDLATCSSAIRYGKTSTLEEALRANHAVLGVLDQLRVSVGAAALLRSAKRGSP